LQAGHSHCGIGGSYTFVSRNEVSGVQLKNFLFVAAALGLLFLASTAQARNIPGIVAAPQPEPGLVLLLPTPGAPSSPDPRHTSGRALARRALQELLRPQSGHPATKSAKLYVAPGGAPINETDPKGMLRWLSGCSVEAAADITSDDTPLPKDYYVVQLACPQKEKPNFKQFAAVTITNGSVTTVVLNLFLTPVWSDRR
jgi:hypothetical protein